MPSKIKPWRIQVRNMNGDELLWWHKILEKQFHANGKFRSDRERRNLEAVESEMRGE